MLKPSTMGYIKVESGKREIQSFQNVYEWKFCPRDA